VSDQIDVVVVTHCHPDHIGGLTAEVEDKREPVFAGRPHYLWASEWQFWTSQETLALVPDVLAAPARLHLPPLADAGVVVTINEETEILPGVRLEPAPGHTPGHTVVSLDSAGVSATYVADAVMHELNFEHPEWVSAFDADPAQAIETRRRILDRAATERNLVMGFHLRRPGRVEKVADAYRLVSAEELAPLPLLRHGASSPPPRPESRAVR
jgi:glyoxylase-like metal-dependent hydrolase (beta-lactamase superfamily II)